MDNEIDVGDWVYNTFSKKVGVVVSHTAHRYFEVMYNRDSCTNTAYVTYLEFLGKTQEEAFAVLL